MSFYRCILTYLGSTIIGNLFLDTEIHKRTRKAATTLDCLTSRVCKNHKVTVEIKMAMYNTCVISTLLYSSQLWTTSASQEWDLNTFHVYNLCYILSRIRHLTYRSYPLQHSYPPQAMQTTLVGPCPLYGGQVQPKRHPTWKASSWEKIHQPPPTPYKDVRQKMKAVNSNISSWESIKYDHTR